MRIVFDTEGDGLREEITQMWCFVAKDIDSGDIHQLIYSSPTFVEDIQALLDSCSLIIGHNIINYDLPVLEKLYDIKYNGRIYDTLVVSKVLNPDRRGGHGLEAWGRRAKRKKPEHEDWSQFSDAMLHRCTEDVEINHWTYNELEKEKQSDPNVDWDKAIALEHKVADIITRQEINGVQFDIEKAEECVRDLDNRMEELYWDIAKHLGYVKDTTKRTCARPFSPDGSYSKKVVKLLSGWELEVSGPFTYIAPRLTERAFIIDKLLEVGWQPTEYTEPSERFPEGQPKLTDKGEPVDSLRELNSDLGQDLALYLTYKQRRSTIKNPTDPTKGWLNQKRLAVDGRLTAGADPCGTPTGRMRHRTVVNVPKAEDDVIYGEEMRSLFIARPGYVIVGHDAAGIENRMLAHYVNDAEFTETIVNGDSSKGTDLHTVLWKIVGEYVSTRSKTKNLEYALFYGAQDPKLGSMCDLKPRGMPNDKMGAIVRELISRNIPALGSLTDRVQKAAKRGYLIGLDGRKLWVRSPHAALNVLLQGGAATVMKVSMCYLDNWVKQYNLDVKKVIDMHDEAQAEVHPDHAELYGKLAVKSIKKAGEYFNLRCALDAEAKIGNNWAETH